MELVLFIHMVIRLPFNQLEINSWLDVATSWWNVWIINRCI